MEEEGRLLAKLASESLPNWRRCSNRVGAGAGLRDSCRRRRLSLPLIMFPIGGSESFLSSLRVYTLQFERVFPLCGIGLGLFQDQALFGLGWYFHYFGLLMSCNLFIWKQVEIKYPNLVNLEKHIERWRSHLSNNLLQESKYYLICLMPEEINGVILRRILPKRWQCFQKNKG